ncbi:MAG: basic secretory protein-like protein, partial [Chloroflexota bacterium]
MLVLGVVAACSAPTTSPSPSANSDAVYQPNPWQQLLSEAGPNGQVSLDLALKAFVVAIGPLPGVSAPQPPLPTTDEIGPGELAIEWVQQHWGELTQEQQDAVSAYLAPASDAIDVEPLPLGTSLWQPGRHNLIAAVGPFAPFDDTPLDQYKEILRDSEIVIINQLGRARTRNYSISVNTSQVGEAKALAYANDWFGSCAIHLNPFLVTTPRTSAEIKATLAHELFHCFQYELGAGAGRDMWVVEGEAEWVGEMAGGPSRLGADWWTAYLTSKSVALFDRTYDAVGFFQHVAERGTNMWKLLDKTYEAANGAAAFHAAADSSGQGFLYSWSSGIFRDSGLAGEWNAQGPWTANFRAAREEIIVPQTGSVPFEVEPYKNRIGVIQTSADIVNIKMDGFARVRDLSGFSQDGLTDVNFCTQSGGTCICPPGSTYQGPILSPLHVPAYLAITGATSGVTGSLTGVSLEDFCQTNPSPQASPTGGPTGRPGGSSSPPCPRGCAGSSGEPHLRTVDNVAYDFQGAGEYTLLRNADSSVEIQSRQEKRGESADISVNTAVAALVNGHRVSVYVGPQRGASGLEVHVDGVVDDLATAVDLGSGGRVVRYASGVEIDLPDGSVVYAIALHTPCCINVVIAPSDSLRTDGAGLLGNVAAGVMPVPALPDGTRLPRVETAHDRFVAVYGQLGPAWQVTDATSLFDYEDGKTS